MLETLKRYLKWVNNPSNIFVPDFKLVGASLDRLLAKSDIEKKLLQEFTILKAEWDIAQSKLSGHYTFGVLS